MSSTEPSLGVIIRIEIFKTVEDLVIHEIAQLDHIRFIPEGLKQEAPGGRYWFLF